MAVREMREGAIEFLTKPVDNAALLKSVETAFQQYRESRRKAVEQENFATRYKTLTPRKRQVLSLLVRGLLNKQVGFELGITEYTVQIHRATHHAKHGGPTLLPSLSDSPQSSQLTRLVL